MDPYSGERHRQRLDFLRGRSGRGIRAAASYLHHATSGMALLLLGLRRDRMGSCTGLVRRGTRQTGTTPASLRGGARKDSSRTHASRRRSGREFRESDCSVGKNSRQQGSVDSHVQLFLLLLRCVDFFQLVFYLFGESARPESESERLLCHAPFSGDGNMLHPRRTHERLADTTRRQTSRRCGVAIFGIMLAGVFLAFGSSAQSARVASVVLAG